MVFDVLNEEQAREILKFAIENDYEFNVDEGSVYDLFIKDEIMEQLEWIYESDEFIDIFTKYDSNELQEFIIKQVKSDIENEVGVWNELDEYVYNRAYEALYTFEKIKEKNKEHKKGND